MYTHLHRCRADLVGDANNVMRPILNVSEHFLRWFLILLKKIIPQLLGMVLCHLVLLFIKYILKEQFGIQILFKLYSFFILDTDDYLLKCCEIGI